MATIEFLVFLACALSALWLVIGIWAYGDARRRGMSGILWFFVVFLLGVIGLIVYLLVRRDPPPPYPYGYPPYPYAPYPAHPGFPAYPLYAPSPPVYPPPPLAAPAPAAFRPCPRCRSPLYPYAAYCVACGMRV